MRNMYIGSALALASTVAFAANKGSGSAPAPVVSASGYAFEDFEIPASARSSVRGGEPSKLAIALGEVPITKSFLEAVTVPDTITDEGERAKEFTALAKRATNRVSGAIRRFKKANPLANFQLRTVNDATLGHGVRVWRVADSTEAPAAPATPPAPPAPPSA